MCYSGIINSVPDSALFNFGECGDDDFERVVVDDVTLMLRLLANSALDCRCCGTGCDGGCTAAGATVIRGVNDEDASLLKPGDDCFSDALADSNHTVDNTDIGICYLHCVSKRVHF